MANSGIQIPEPFSWLLSAHGLVAGVVIYSTYYVFSVGSIPFILSVVAVSPPSLLPPSSPPPPPLKTPTHTLAGRPPPPPRHLPLLRRLPPRHPPPLDPPTLRPHRRGPLGRGPLLLRQRPRPPPRQPGPHRVARRQPVLPPAPDVDQSRHRDGRGQRRPRLFHAGRLSPRRHAAVVEAGYFGAGHVSPAAAAAGGWVSAVPVAGAAAAVSVSVPYAASSAP